MTPSIRTALGDPVWIRKLESSPRSEVWVVEFDGEPAIVKHVTAGPDAADRYHREVTALGLASQVRPRPVAQLLGTDPTARVLVLEYLHSARPAGRRWSLDYATALARLHSVALSAGSHALPDYHGPGNDDVEAFLGLARRLGVPVPPSTRGELHTVLSRLDAGRGALLHGDPCPDNAVVTDDGIRFIDLEHAQRGPAMMELSYLRIGFPTCWCVTALPQQQVAEAEAAYQDTWRSLAGASPAGDLIDACVGWVVQGDALVDRARRGTADHLTRASRRDWRWGTATARERLIHRLDVVAALAGDRGDLSGVATVTQAMGSAIRSRWPHLSRLPATSGNPLTAR